MAISKIDPPNYDGANSVLVDSDAPTNVQALREIDDWAFAHGFARTGEYYLRPVVRAGARYFRGVCYRITEEEREGTAEYLREVAESAERLAPPRTA